MNEKGGSQIQNVDPILNKNHPIKKQLTKQTLNKHDVR